MTTPDPTTIHVAHTAAPPDGPGAEDAVCWRNFHDEARRLRIAGLESKVRGLEFCNHRLKLDVGNLTIGKHKAEEAWRWENIKVRGLENQVADLKAAVDDARDVAIKLADEKTELRRQFASLPPPDPVLESRALDLLARQRSEIATLKSELAIREGSIEGLKGRLSQAEAEITRQYDLARSARDELSSLRARLAAIEGAAEMLLHRLGQMSPTDRHAFGLKTPMNNLMDSLAHAPAPRVAPPTEERRCCPVCASFSLTDCSAELVRCDDCDLLYSRSGSERWTRAADSSTPSPPEDRQ